jgi:putative nucleotidyltransferase with HDIG domain
MLAMDSVSRIKSNALELRLAALLHDIGKPYTEVTINNKLHFYNHENVGAYITEKILLRWGFNKSITAKIVLLVQNHLFDANPNKSEISIKKLIQKIGSSNIHDLLDLRIADRNGTGRSNISMDNVNKLRDVVNKILGMQDLEHFKLALTDEELFKYVNTVEAVTQVKLYLTYKILAGKLQNKASSLKRAILKILKINCPLDKEHLFRTWSEIQNNSVDCFPNGNLKCGIFCNFTCNRKLETDQ